MDTVRIQSGDLCSNLYLEVRLGMVLVKPFVKYLTFSILKGLIRVGISWFQIDSTDVRVCVI